MKILSFQFKIRTWIQIGLLPTLTGVALWIGWGLYGELRQVILQSFDMQLTSPSVVAAAFINPVEHEWLAEKRHLRALTYAKDEDVFYALADTRGQTALVRLSPVTGRTEGPGAIPSLPISDLAVDDGSQRLFCLIAKDGTLGLVEPRTGMVTSIARSPSGIREIAKVQGQEGIWLMFSTTVGRWNSSTSELTLVVPLPAAVGSPHLAGSYAKGGGILLVNESHRTLLWWVIDSGAVSEIAWQGKIDFPRSVGYDEKRDHWVVAQERLRLFDPAAGRDLPDTFEAAYGREDTDEYRRIVAPLSRIQQRLGLSYLYTQIVKSPDLITYVVDSPVGGTHSELMSQDVLPADEVEGITRLLANGSLHFTKLQRWEQWGWLKSSFAPIFNKEGRVVAMTGTDFNASVIENSTRRALLMVFLIGGITLVLASIWSLTISRRLRRPLEALKAGALDVATGDFRSLQVNGSQEVKLLADVFNQVGAAMATSSTNLTKEVTRLLRRRDRAEVNRVFSRGRLTARVFEDDPDVNAHSSEFNVGGTLVMGDMRLVWWEDFLSDGVEPMWRQLCALPGQVGAHFGSLPAEANDPARWPEHVRCVLRLNLQEKTGVWWARDPDDSPVQVGDSTSTKIGWPEAGPVLELTGFVIKEGGS